MKVIITCGLVLGYVKFAPHMGMAFWRYLRCPAFCIGMLFALHDNALRERFVRWQALAALCFVLLVISLPYWHRFDSYLYPTALFLFMYCFRSIKETRIVKFISSISLEMFIIQYLPIYIVTDDLHITNTWLVVVLVLILDVIFAYIIHQIILKLQKYM